MANPADPHDATLPSSAPTSGDTPSRDFLLVVGEGELRTVPLAPGGAIEIGRAPDCEISLSHGKVSRRHARVVAGTPAMVEDLGSTNGIKVRGDRIREGQRAALNPGDSFRIGPFVVVLLREVGASDPTIAPCAALVVSDPTNERVSPIVARIAAAPVSVIIRGETGVGKEVLARTLHAHSQRGGPMVGLNCAAISEALLESELFGHERGAFTGAVQAKPGLLESAAGGTVLLDEVGDMPLALQTKLLRAIEERKVFRVGGVKAIALDVRFLAATHRDLRADVEAGRFRRDLYYRLNGFTLVIPPLRERRGAIATLAHELLAEANARFGDATACRISAAALARLETHSWPGNVRELRAVIERAVLLANGADIGIEHLVLEAAPDQADPPASPAVDLAPAEADERARIVAALEECAGNQTRAAKLLGISRATLVNKLAVYRIPRPRR